jgi:hypothetical protein
LKVIFSIKVSSREARNNRHFVRHSTPLAIKDSLQYKNINDVRLGKLVAVLLLFVISSCSSIQRENDGTLPDLSAVSEEEKVLRLKYGIYEGEPRTKTEMINQIFADDDIDPHNLSSRRFREMALRTYELNTDGRQNVNVDKPYKEQYESAGRQRYEMALDRLLLSPSFREIYDSQLKLLLGMSRSRIEFNNQGMNCGGTVRGGAFGEELLGVVLYFDFSEETNILTTRGFVKALPERIIAHELLESRQSINCLELAYLSKGDEGVVGMGTVLQVNKIMRELVKAGALSPIEGASRIRYYR